MTAAEEKEYSIMIEGVVRSVKSKQDIETELAIRFSDQNFQAFKISISETES